LYVGPAGVAYALGYASKCEHLDASIRQKISASATKMFHESVTYFKQVCKLFLLLFNNLFLLRVISSPTHSHLQNSQSDPHTDAGFLCGGVGVYSTYAMTTNDKSEQTMCTQMISATRNTILPNDYLGCGSDEILVGRAGWLCAIACLR
jgi:hypothetical protein